MAESSAVEDEDESLASFESISQETGTSKQAVHKVYTMAKRNFARNWRLLEIIESTNLDDTSKFGLQRVVVACQTLLKVMNKDRRAG